MEMTTCSDCGGSGKARCMACRGGWVDMGGTRMVCAVCSGTQRFDCLTCSGTGRVYAEGPGAANPDCLACRGSGREKCKNRYCRNGTQYSDEYAWISAPCPDCSGRGWNPRTEPKVGGLCGNKKNRKGPTENRPEETPYAGQDSAPQRLIIPAAGGLGPQFSFTAGPRLLFFFTR